MGSRTRRGPTPIEPIRAGLARPTRLLLGEEFETLQEDVEEFGAAAEDDTSQYIV